jgi:hypothetical protein
MGWRTADEPPGPPSSRCGSDREVAASRWAGGGLPRLREGRVSPILRACPTHGLYPPGGPSKGRCPTCYQEDNRRRTAKQRDQGRTTRHWKNLARAAKQAAGYRCQSCGAPEVPEPAGWLSVHLRPELGGNHRAATLPDVVVLCLSCHGTVDAPRAHLSPAEPPNDQDDGLPLIA